MYILSIEGFKGMRLAGFLISLSMTGLSLGQGYAVSLIAPFGAISQAQNYTINDGGQIAGNSQGQAFRWTPDSPNGTSGNLTLLGVPSGWDFSEGFGLNNQGDVVGRFGEQIAIGSRPPRAVLWQANGTTVELGSGGMQSEAYAITDSQSVLMMHFKNGVTSAVVSKIAAGKRKLYTVGTSFNPVDMNNGLRVLGLHRNGSPSGGVPLYTSNAQGTAWSSQIIVANGAGYDLNEHGEAVGSMNAGTNINHPFLYVPTPKYGFGAGVTDLWSVVSPALPTPNTPGAEWKNGSARALNDNGTILGDAVAYTWTGTSWTFAERTTWIWSPSEGTRSLGQVLADLGWTLNPDWTGQCAVNNAGQIVCAASNDGGFTYQTVLLTPQ